MRKDLERSQRSQTLRASACFVSLSFAGLVVLARSLNPIPSRTRPLNSSAPMVLWLKPWESRSLPGLPRTKIFLFTCHDQTERRFPSGRRRFVLRLCARKRAGIVVHGRVNGAPPHERDGHRSPPRARPGFLLVVRSQADGRSAPIRHTVGSRRPGGGRGSSNFRCSDRAAAPR